MNNTKPWPGTASYLRDSLDQSDPTSTRRITFDSLPSLWNYQPTRSRHEVNKAPLPSYSDVKRLSSIIDESEAEPEPSRYKKKLSPRFSLNHPSAITSLSRETRRNISSVDAHSMYKKSVKPPTTIFTKEKKPKTKHAQTKYLPVTWEKSESTTHKKKPSGRLTLEIKKRIQLAVNTDCNETPLTPADRRSTGGGGCTEEYLPRPLPLCMRGIIPKEKIAVETWLSTAMKKRKRKLVASGTGCLNRSYAWKTPGAIIAWRRPPSWHRRKIVQSDPVALYSFYDHKWKTFLKHGVPGEARHAEVRWCTRHKMLEPKY